MILTRLLPPAGPPVALDRIKARCSVLHDDFDVLLAELTEQAEDYLDGPAGILGRAICTQTWRLELACWPSDYLLPVDPVQSFSVSYQGLSGSEWHAAPDGAFWLRAGTGRSPRLQRDTSVTLPDLATSPLPVRVDLVCGFGEPGSVDIPPAIRGAIGMMVDHWYRNRGIVASGTVSAEMDMMLSDMLSRWRRHL